MAAVYTWTNVTPLGLINDELDDLAKTKGDQTFNSNAAAGVSVIINGDGTNVPNFELEQLATGDAAMLFTLPAGSIAMGLDNTANDNFVMAYSPTAGGAVLGTNNILTIRYLGDGRTRLPAGNATTVGQKEATTEIHSNSATLNGSAAATITASNLIPAHALLIGISGRITTTFTGATSFHVGDGSDADLWGASIAVAAGTTFDNTDATANPQGTWSASGRSVTLTAVGGTGAFTSTGSIQLIAHYLSTCAASG